MTKNEKWEMMYLMYKRQIAKQKLSPREAYSLVVLQRQESQEKSLRKRLRKLTAKGVKES
jgi:hypothetical protein